MNTATKWFCALAASLALTGCAYINGPCEVVDGIAASAVCEQGGTLIVVPSPRRLTVEH